MHHRTRRYARLTVALGVVGIVAACGDTDEDLPAFDSLESAYQAVDDAVDCAEDASDPPTKILESDGPTGESVMCTNTVEVLWFETQDARDDVYDLLAGAAGPTGAVYFAVGRNWFVADVSEVAVGAAPEREMDMEGLAEVLGAQYTVEQ